VSRDTIADGIAFSARDAMFGPKRPAVAILMFVSIDGDQIDRVTRIGDL
jgi:hypothetical protein